MPRLRIDNREIEVAAGATILDAARRLGIDIPTLCYLEGCAPQTSCLACVVKVNGSQRLVPSCATKVQDGMKVESETDEVRAARRTALELLLGDHAGDCLAPCQTVCPAHMDIPTMIRRINAGQMREAIVTVKDAIALPAVLGRICPELCEKGCRRGQKDQPVSICALKRFVADVDLASGHPYLPSCLPDSGMRTAIVGTGPAGLAAAWHLLQAGHACVLFDQNPLPGGNLRYAIGEDKLPRDVLDAEIGLIRALGARFDMGVRVGSAIPLAELKRSFDAVLLAIGEVDAPKAAALGLESGPRGLKIDHHTMMTSLDGVFAAGGAILPLRHAVRAVADGHAAATVIDGFLRGQPVHRPGHVFSSRLGTLKDDELALFMSGAAEVPRAQPADGLVPLDALTESTRCMGCECGKVKGCKLRRYAWQYHANAGRYRGQRRAFQKITAHPSVIYEPGKCIACGLCVQITSRSAEPLGLTYVGRGFDVRIGVPFNGEMSQALQRVARQCVDACPTGALCWTGVSRRGIPLPVLSSSSGRR